MPGVTRVGDKCTGHDGYEPKPLIEGSKTFKVDGRSVGLVGCHYEEHSKPNADTHQDYIAEGAPSVFIEGKPVARIGDKVEKGGTVAEGSTTFIIGNKGGQDYGISIGYPIAHQLTKALYSEQLTPIDEVILELPAIAENEAKTDCDNENDKLGWMELAQMLRFWLMRNEYVLTEEDWKKGRADIYKFRLGLSWFQQYYRFNVAYDELVDEAFSDAGKESLKQVLEKSEEWKRIGIFDCTKLAPKDWNAFYFNQRIVGNLPSISVDGMHASLAEYAINAMASCTRVEIKGKEYINVNKLCIYMRDLFNFEGKQGYGYWSKEKLDFIWLNWDNDPLYYEIDNLVLNMYRHNYGKGGDFLVLSNLWEVEDFSPILIPLD